MQVFELIKTLTPPEIRDIRIVLRSDWFNYREDVRLLFEALVKAAAKKNAEMPDKTALLSLVFPENAKADDRLLRLVGSWLQDGIEDYFRWKTVSEEAVFSHIRLARWYRQRNLPAFFRKKTALGRTALEQQPLRNAEYWQQYHELLAEEYRMEAATKRTEAMNMQALGDALDTWYFAQKLRQVCLALSHQAVYKTEYQFGFLPTILEQVEQQHLTETPAIGLYYYCYQALIQPENEAVFAVFREKIRLYGAAFPEEELRDLYLLAINFCTRRVNQGSKAHIREGFELYRTGFEQGIFIINGILSRFTYRNAAALGLMLHELDWVAGFLPQFRDFLEKQYRDSTYSFSLARLEYARKDYGKVLTLLQNAEYEDLLATLSAKTLTLKVLYETGALDSLHSHLDAMRIFIRRHKEIGYHRDNYLNMLRFTQRLIALQHLDKEVVAKLKEDILEEKKVAEKEWLLGKV